MNVTANDVQVGGSHYKGTAIQHWDMAARADLGYFEGQATKYFSRFRKKNGLQDIDKGIHFLQKTRELAEGGRRCQANQAATFHMTEFCRSNDFDRGLTAILTLCVTWRNPEQIDVILHDVYEMRKAYNSEIEAKKD